MVGEGLALHKEVGGTFLTPGVGEGITGGGEALSTLEMTMHSAMGSG